ncbi:hypothetical protein PsB1_1520 [Candidatus Phycosocius spiralis]|uniref:Uncharacterized protein n=1 Tax=Candidatus Phycosocius spiralis TaxID=2815099 RepID=A0ABQ4PWP5_9PROT|nr:hypothetical protein PsB1_1520 [Candidatus Phycosocius spiralis]
MVIGGHGIKVGVIRSDMPTNGALMNIIQGVDGAASATGMPTHLIGAVGVAGTGHLNCAAAGTAGTGMTVAITAATVMAPAISPAIANLVTTGCVAAWRKSALRSAPTGMEAAMNNLAHDGLKPGCGS